MKISLQDRELARELAELFDLDEQAMKMLGVVLSSHRQLPADEKLAEQPTVRGLGWSRSCGKLDVDTLRRCALPAGHEPRDCHETDHDGAFRT